MVVCGGGEEEEEEGFACLRVCGVWFAVEKKAAGEWPTPSCHIRRHEEQWRNVPSGPPVQ